MDIVKAHSSFSRVTIKCDPFSKPYVSGYPDGTFKPNNPVTRAEFMRMLTSALNLPHSQKGEPWYQPYVASLRENFIYKDSDYRDDFNRQLSRAELVRLAVRAVDSEYRAVGVKEDSNYMVYQAAEKGILAGVGNGRLDLSGTTTRAQAVAIIERILSVNKGEKLQADKYAVANAELLWHRTNIFTVMSDMFDENYNSKYSKMGIGSWKLENLKLENDKFSAELDELIAIDLADPNDPNRHLLPSIDKMEPLPNYGAKMPKDAYVLIGRYHINYNKDPKSYANSIDIKVWGFYQPSPMIFDKIIVPWRVKSLDPQFDWINQVEVDKNGKGSFVRIIPRSDSKFKEAKSLSIDLYSSGYPGAPLEDFMLKEIMRTIVK